MPAIKFDLESSSSDICPLELDDTSNNVFEIAPFVYNDSIDTTAMTNVLLIDNTIQEYQQFVSGCNANTFPIVYDYHSDRNELKEFLARKFSNIQRIAFVFHNAGMNDKLFLNNQCFFNETPFSENFQVVVDIIRDFQVGHVDYLACNSLEYDNWKQYYELMKTTANVVIGASNDATGNIQYGGDWVMETTNEDIKTLYFNESIDDYTKTLATSTISASTTVTNADLNNTNLYTWPITINGGTSSSRVVITFGDDITLNNVNKYFIIGSDYITVDGGNKTVTISGVTNYPGLIRNGTGNASTETKITNGQSNITVQNIKISSSNSILPNSGGWICQAFYGNSSSGTNLITNCTNNNGIIPWKSGGIAGHCTFAFSTGTNTLSNCRNMGEFSDWQGGGIVGRRFAYSSSSTNTITGCTNGGTISQPLIGGIAGFGYATSSSGTNTITNCTNIGIISGDSAGGIVGQQFARDASAGSINTIEKCSNIGNILGLYAGGITGSGFGLRTAGTNKITDCSNSGDISGNYAGGIAGAQFAQEASAGSINTIEKCSNNGNISGKYAGGISGLFFAFRAAGMNTISNCYNNGDISGNYTGGITGAQFAQETTSSSINTITNCSNSGNILGLYAGGIAGQYFALLSSGTNKITDCTNNGNILGNSAGGISGKFTGYRSSGTNTITNCVNHGDISGNFTGGIAGGAIAYTDASNISPTLIISNSYSIGVIRNTTGTGGICAGFDGKDFIDASNIFIDISYSTTSTAIIKNCYSLHGNIKAPTQSDKVTFNITNTYEADGSWSSNYALRNLLLKDASNVYVWAYQKDLSANDQTNSPFTLRSLNITNSYVGEISPTITFTIPSPKTFGIDTSFTLTDLSSNSPADFSYNSSNPAVATISNRKVTITGGGTTEITVRQDACGNYLDGSANQQLVVKAILYRNQFVISKNNYVKIIPRKYGIYINNVTSRRISPALPDGLKFSSITGIISGTPVSTSQSKIYKIWTTQTIDNVVTTYRKIITIEIV